MERGCVTSYTKCSTQKLLRVCIQLEPHENKFILYIFWLFPRRQIIVGQRFGTLCQFHLQRLDVDCLHPAFEDGTDTRFRNVGQL